jgi:hypothetical protein
MYQNSFLSSTRLFATLGAVLLLAGTASAQDPLKCRRAIAKNAVKFEATKLKSLQKCEDSLLNGKVPACPDSKATDKIAAAQAKLAEQVDKNCAGLSLADMNFAGLAKQCTGGYRNNQPCDVAADCPGICVTGPKDGDPCFADAFCAPGTCSSPSLCDAVDVCPSVQNDSRVEPFGLLPVSDCYFALSDAASVAACVTCVGDETVDQLIGDYYGTANPASEDKAVLKCQRTVGKAAAKHFAAVRKSLQKCQDGILKGGSGPCPDAKAAEKIGKSQVKLSDAITKACSDAQLNSGFVLSQIIGASGRPNAGCTTLAADAAGIAAAIECLTTATATANDALGVGSSPAANNPTCGNAKLDAGENCDDGNQLQESGVGPADFCPTDCNIAACTPNGAVGATVNFTAPADLTSLTVVLYYPDAKVQVPGVNSDPPVQNAVLSSSFATTPVDTGYALRVVSIDPSLVGVPSGAAFGVTFDTCQGAPALSAGDLACFVADASDANAAPVFGATCSVTVP